MKRPLSLLIFNVSVIVSYHEHAENWLTMQMNELPHAAMFIPPSVLAPSIADEIDLQRQRAVGIAL